MPAAPRFTRDPNTPSRRRAAALADADELLHAALVQARRDQGLSQQNVADLMGVTQPTVAAFERYDNDPRLSTIRRYAHAVGVVVTHTVSRDGAQVPRGWEPASSGSATFTVNPGVERLQLSLAAPSSARADLAPAS